MNLISQASFCIGGKRYQPAGVSIYVFDATKSPQLLTLLKEIASSPEPNPDDSVGVERFFARDERLLRLVKTSKRLATEKSDAEGKFKIEIPAAGSNLIVFGYADSADGPPSYAFSEVRLDGHPNNPVILDFTHGHCQTPLTVK